MPSKSSSTGRTSVGYYCRAAQQDAGHSRPYYVSESKLLPWVKEQAAIAGKVVQVGLATEVEPARSGDLEARRERLMEMYADGRFPKAKLDRLMAAVDAAQSQRTMKSAAMTSLSVIDRVDWDDPKATNAALRGMWDAVQLGPQLQPEGVEWRWEDLANRAVRQADELDALMDDATRELRDAGLNVV